MRTLLVALALGLVACGTPSEPEPMEIQLAPSKEGIEAAQDAFLAAQRELEAKIDDGTLTPRYRLEALVYVNRCHVAMRDINAAFANKDTVLWAEAHAHLQKNMLEMHRLATEPQP